MRHDSRMLWAVIAATAVFAAAGSAPASDRDGLPNQQRVAQTIGAVQSPATAAIIDNQNVQAVLGRQVLGSGGQDMGRVIDIVVDRNGQVRAAVIDFGGFLGVGSRKIAVDWAALRFAPTGNKFDRITVDLTRDQVKAAPEYKDGRPLFVVGAAEELHPSQPPH